LTKIIHRHQGVSIIACTNRPQFFKNIIDNYKKQLYRVKELVIVLNKDSMALSQYRKKVRSYSNVSVYKVPEKVSLGKCLNYGVSAAKYPFIAKFDDDDYYSPYYLKEQMKALYRSGASIVGKRARLIYLEGKKLLLICAHKDQNKFVRIIAGGTILFKRQVFNRVHFDDVSLGEDTNFLRKSWLRGYKIYASSPYNYVGIRRKNKKTHTWTATDEAVMRGNRILAKTVRFRTIAIRPPK
jgi:glycosyltransferase involved in cell wall biosynthesis